MLRSLVVVLVKEQDYQPHGTNENLNCGKSGGLSRQRWILIHCDGELTVLSAIPHIPAAVV